MPVLGADPDEVQMEWEEPTAPLRHVRPSILALVNYFAYHPDMQMSQRMNNTDKAILGRFFVRKTSTGYTDDTLRKMVDEFYQSWGKDSELPALAFVSNEMQEKLTQRVDIVTDDPALQWLLDGMPNEAPGWDGKEMRKAVLIHSGDLLHRYPELVATVVAKGLDPADVTEGLQVLDDLVRWNLKQEGIERPHEWKLTYWKRHIAFPEKLLSRLPRPSAVAKERGLIHQALAPKRKTDVDWSTQ